MRLSKSQALLYLFTKFQHAKQVKKAEEIQRLELSDITFKRYVAEIRRYYETFCPTHSLVYSRRENCYFLKCIKNAETSSKN